jgi:adenylate cyclase
MVCTVLGVVVQAAVSIRLADANGIWLPMGTIVLAWLASIGGAASVASWQVRRAQYFTSALFSRFMTPALAAEAWRDRHLYLEGGRPAPMLVPVTVLFLDLRGFTRFSEAAGPAAVMTLLTTVTAACAADIAAHGGLLDDFAGDGIKADFGVPVPRSTAEAIAQEARNAVQCARTLAITLQQLLPASLGTAGTQVRIGIHSGNAVAGTIGGASRLKYTVAGDVVNVAARLQSVDLADDGSAAAPCRILISADTLALLGADAPGTKHVGMLTLSGRTSPVNAFRISVD